MKIAVLLGDELQSGGSFKYQMSVAKLLTLHQSHEYEFYFFANKKTADLFKTILPVQVIEENFIHKFHRFFLRNIIFLKTCQITKVEKLFDKYDIDLVYFLYPSGLSLDLVRHNYVITFWDIIHRDFPEFPEVNFYREFEIREEFYDRSLKKAVAVIAESEFGKQNILKKYNIDSYRITICPFLLPPNIKKFLDYSDKGEIRIKNKYSLKNQYVFYPAQFWSGKNHIYILKALKTLKDKYSLFIDAVFCGSDMGNLKHVLAKAKEFAISEQVRYLGFVDDHDIPLLYKNALALVMPTYFGPTNIPPLEAFALGCPVCYSDIDGLRGQIKDAGFLIDLKDPDTLAKIIIQIINNRELVNEKINIGKKLINEWTEEEFWSNLKEIFDNFRIKRECWK